MADFSSRCSSNAFTPTRCGAHTLTTRLLLTYQWNFLVHSRSNETHEEGEETSKGENDHKNQQENHKSLQVLLIVEDLFIIRLRGGF